MSFKTNDCQQLSLDDSFMTLTERERKALEKSWAKIFADEIFPAIDEERFSVLYSDKASRPNAPVNVIIGALIIEEVTEYQLFVRCLSDQTVVENEKRRLRTKEDGTMNSSALQNPSDPDATYRNKSGKLYRGYAANIEETVGKNGSVVTDYQYDKNTHTDSLFLQESLSAMEKSEEEIILITDGGYDGQDNIALAKEKNVRLVTTTLIGKEAPDALADFEFNEDGTRLLKCAAGHEPVSQSFTKTTRQCRVSFDRNHCAGCPYQEQCRPKIYKKVATFITSKNASNRAKSQRYMQSEEFSHLARLRNGVETIPANIRKNYHLDKLPRGKQRGKFFFGSKIAALNLSV